MKVLTLAAGLAVGYVLGSRAGHDKYEQIKAGAIKLSNNPKVQQAQAKAKDAIATGTDAATSKLAAVRTTTEAETPVSAGKAVPSRPKAETVVVPPLA